MFEPEAQVVPQSNDDADTHPHVPKGEEPSVLADVCGFIGGLQRRSRGDVVLGTRAVLSG